MNEKEIEQEMKKYEKLGFDYFQLTQIRYGLKEGVDVDRYANPEFDTSQMYEIRLGLEKELKTKELEMETQRRVKK